MTVGVLASGALGHRLLLHLQAEWSIPFVCTDKGSTAIISFCEKESIPVFVGNPRKGKAVAFLQGMSCDLLLSVNYLFLIEADLIRLPKHFAVNVHGSLLPKYRGRTPHVWAIINNETETGITAHLIDENCDTGPVLKQILVPISPEDTGADLLNKFHRVYPDLIDEVLEDFVQDRLEPQAQKDELATYFGKRTPEDGGIHWDWSKERIVNWIRAQAPPYPGAFSHLKGEKIIFRKAKMSAMGFHSDQPNGTVLNVVPLIVKTPNGALELEIEGEQKNKMELNQVFKTRV